ncbi:MAG: TlyA family RNA methyltransferase [Clostridiales bacterium]|nr:TlyA family RNA methyltransferase [Clostridiales bacterium]MCF8021187.1 TlyA family RNA methyltransferase [Clostridiales bacterium]
MGSKQKKERLDLLLVSRGFALTREKARAFIMAGQVKVDDQKIDKPGKTVPCSAKLEMLERQRYVSRGGKKLEKALISFNIDLTNSVVLDVGASTGGFTDCILQNGARKVYAVDVGYGQLDWSLRNDPRVKVMERTNIRRMERSMLNEIPDFAVIDVSFISLTIILPTIKMLTAEDASVVALIKPQFEAGQSNVGNKGVVRDSSVHVDVLNKIINAVESEREWGIIGLDYSPIKGPEGNIEYIIYFTKNKTAAINVEKNANKVVELAHMQLN